MQDLFQEGKSLCVLHGYSGNVKNGSLLRKQSLTISSWNLELQGSAHHGMAETSRDKESKRAVRRMELFPVRLAYS